MTKKWKICWKFKEDKSKMANGTQNTKKNIFRQKELIHLFLDCFLPSRLFLAIFFFIGILLIFFRLPSTNDDICHPPTMISHSSSATKDHHHHHRHHRQHAIAAAANQNANATSNHHHHRHHQVVPTVPHISLRRIAQIALAHGAFTIFSRIRLPRDGQQPFRQRTFMRPVAASFRHRCRAPFTHTASDCGTEMICAFHLVEFTVNLPSGRGIHTAHSLDAFEPICAAGNIANEEDG